MQTIKDLHDIPSTRGTQHKYGWLPDHPDHRDLRYGLIMPKLDIPRHIDLRDTGFFPWRYDQENIGSCTGNGWGIVHHFWQLKNKIANPFVPSRLQIYWDERNEEGMTDTDSGAMIRDGAKILARNGTGDEKLWPYLYANLFKQPTQPVYDMGKRNQVVAYHRISNDETEILTCLASGKPIVVGVSIYNSFETDFVAKTGRVPMPSNSETLLGGHCIVIPAADQDTRRFGFINCWGVDWGCNGDGTLPFDYLLDENLSDDFWAIDIQEKNTDADAEN